MSKRRRNIFIASALIFYDLLLYRINLLVAPIYFIYDDSFDNATQAVAVSVYDLNIYYKRIIMPKSIIVYIVPQYDLDTWYIEELTSETFDTYVAKYPYSPFFEETQDGFFLTDGIAGLGYANHFVFLKESTMRLRQERSIVLYSSPTVSNRYPIEVYQEKIRPAPYEGVYEYCRDGYDVNMSNKPPLRHNTILCKDPKTFEVINAHYSYEYLDYHAHYEGCHGKDAGWDSVDKAYKDYRQAIANYQVDRD